MDISSLPKPVAKSNGPKREMLGQLSVTPDVASKISNMKENKSLGVDSTKITEGNRRAKLVCHAHMYLTCHCRCAICAEPCIDEQLGMDVVSSTCPTTKVILLHKWGKMANAG